MSDGVAAVAAPPGKAVGSRVELPALRVRGVQLAAAALAGGAAGWVAPGWTMPLLFFTAMLAGVSSLWSP